jgi:ketosteroid isomerase-like protein
VVARSCSVGAVLICSTLAALAEAQAPGAAVLEVRIYTLKPGVREAFHARFVRESLPLLQRAGVDVVAFGPSLHDRDSYYLMRAFRSVEERERAEARFYGSREWREGPRDAVLAAIETYTTAVLSVDPPTLKGLRDMPNPSSASRSVADDVAVLVRLNDDYIDAVRTSNVKRFSEILAEDFLCTLADGTLVNRSEFLTQAAKPPTARGLQVHDVNVRLLGDTAIVHAATTFTHPDGRPGRGRYTDVWARRDGRWLAVAAQFVRQ